MKEGRERGGIAGERKGEARREGGERGHNKR